MFNLGFDKRRNCLVGIYKGMYSEEIFTACVEKLKAAITLNPCMRFVIDMRQADMVVKTINFHKWYVIFNEAGLDDTWKKAVLLPADAFAEIREKNIMKNCKDMSLFGDIKEAIAWLVS